MALLAHGGPVLTAIFLLSFFTWFLIVKEWLLLRDETKGGFDGVESVMTALNQGNIGKAIAACGEQPGLAGRMMLMALAVSRSSRGFSRKHRNEIIARETAQLRGHLELIAAAGAVLPLMGLLGTVLGIMRTFDALARHTAYETKTLMAVGVSEALITTQAGLVAALPIVLMHGILSSHIRRYMDDGALILKQMETMVGRERGSV